MKLFKYGLPLAALALMASCTSDKLDGPSEGVVNDVENLYFQLSLTAGGITRTATGDEGQEVGQPDENKVYDVQLIFANKDGKYLGTSELLKIEDGQDISTSAATKVFTVKGDNAAENGIFDGVKANEDIYFYIVCNYGSKLKSEDFTGSNVQKVLTQSEKGNDKFWSSEDGFLMSSAYYDTYESNKVQFPQGGFSNDINNPTPLGTVMVQRAAVRFDIAPGVRLTNSIVGKVKVTFDAAALINQSKEFYLFKEVQTNKGDVTTLAGNAFTMLKKEATGLYVNDPKWWNEPLVKDQASYTVTAPESDKFFYPLNTSDETDIEEVLTFMPYTTLIGKTPTAGDLSQTPNKEPDNSNWDDTRNYYLFGYTTPNTIIDQTKQFNGNTTGVVFRAYLEQDDALSNPVSGFADGKTLYAYAGVLYGDKAELDKMVQDKANYNVNDHSKELAAIDAYETLVSADAKAGAEDPFNAAMVAAKFTVYKYNTQDRKYYMYYYYWNRHDHNYLSKNDGDMEVMEFGVVRNNIYKLAVTNVKGLGHPGKPGDDPDDPKPNTPDDPKDKDAYFSVSVQVIPWWVRVNDIEF